MEEYLAYPLVGAIYGGVGSALIGAKDAGFSPQWILEPREFANEETIKYNWRPFDSLDPMITYPYNFGFSRNLLAPAPWVDIIIGSPSCAQFSTLGMKRKDRGKLNVFLSMTLK